MNTQVSWNFSDTRLFPTSIQISYVNLNDSHDKDFNNSRNLEFIKKSLKVRL